MNTRQVIIVVNAAQAAQANAAAKTVDIVGGEKTFNVGLSATGSEPWTHYWCSWNMTAPDEAAIRKALEPLGAAVRFHEDAATAVNAEKVKPFDAAVKEIA